MTDACTSAVMAYRIVLGTRAAKKTVHLLLHLVALGFAAVGLYAAFKYHRDAGLADIRSLHSWLGIATIALYALQVSQSPLTKDGSSTFFFKKHFISLL